MHVTMTYMSYLSCTYVKSVWERKCRETSGSIWAGPKQYGGPLRSTWHKGLQWLCLEFQWLRNRFKASGKRSPLARSNHLVSTETMDKKFNPERSKSPNILEIASYGSKSRNEWFHHCNSPTGASLSHRWWMKSYRFPLTLTCYPNSTQKEKTQHMRHMCFQTCTYLVFILGTADLQLFRESP